MKKAFIQTFGCQMNEHDSDRIKVLLKRENYEITDNMDEAKLILLNTCSVRENPENKVYSLIGTLKSRKQTEDDLIIGVGGCVAQQEGKNILKRNNMVDLVFGPDNIFHIGEMLAEVKAGNRVVRVAWQERKKKVQNFIPESEIKTGKVKAGKALVSITKGCDNFCSYCIVPYTRGRLVSRDHENILEECSNLINKGAVEITLLGQNVNSYGTEEYGFPELLKDVADIDGLKRLRFTSPYPNDWTNELSDLLTSHPNICNQLHLPFQAGGDNVLKAMKRDHKIKTYLEKMHYLKSINPDIALGTDLIVGFPGETEEDFECTLDVMRQLQFKQVFAYKYSPRPGTKALSLGDTVSRQDKEKRLAKVLDLHQEIAGKLLQADVGKYVSVLIEGKDLFTDNAVKGRTEANTQITIENCDAKSGDLIMAEVTQARAYSLVGKAL